MQCQFIFSLIPNLEVLVLEDLNAKLQKRSTDIQLRGTRKYANSFDRMHRQFLLTLKKFRATFSLFLFMLPRKSVQVSASKISFSMFINLFWTRKTECHNFLLHSRTSNFVSFSVKNLPLWEYKASISRKFCMTNILCSYYTANILGSSTCMGLAI